MPANPITTLTDRRVLNAVINKRIKPYTALTNLLFPNATKDVLFEETAQIDVLTGTGTMAPFVKVGQKAILLDGLNGTSYTVATPYINIKRAMQYSTRLAKRMAGQPVFSQNAGIIREIVLKAIEDDVDIMNSAIDDRIEWMIAMLLRGQLTYSEEGFDSFTYDTGKPAANTYTVTNLWNGGSATPLKDIADVGTIVGNNRGPAPTIAVCGATAAAALWALLEAGSITAIKTTSGIDAGRATLVAAMGENGMRHICTLVGGIDFWEYTGKFYPYGGGAAEDLIRSSYIEYFSTAKRSEDMRKLYFGLIPDVKAILEGNAVTERYLASKAPDVDQGTYEGFAKSRPLPWFMRPDWQVSQKVV